MAVGVERDGDTRVSERLAHYLRVDALPPEQRRAGVPEVVEPYVGKPGTPEERLPRSTSADSSERLMSRAFAIR